MYRAGVLIFWATGIPVWLFGYIRAATSISLNGQAVFFYCLHPTLPFRAAFHHGRRVLGKAGGFVQTRPLRSTSMIYSHYAAADSGASSPFFYWHKINQAFRKQLNSNLEKTTWLKMLKEAMPAEGLSPLSIRSGKTGLDKVRGWKSESEIEREPISGFLYHYFSR